MMLTEKQKKKAEQLRADGMTWTAIGERFGINESAIRYALKPEEWREKRRAKTREVYRKSKKVIRGDDVPTIEIPEETKREWFARAIAYAARTDLTAIICGDPLPGWSALERR